MPSSVLQVIASGPLTSVADALPPLLAALRTVWVISRHYSDDDRMSRLLQRIAHALEERCHGAIDPKVRGDGGRGMGLGAPVEGYHVLCMLSSR